MNILQLTTHLDIGGIASYVVNLAKGLKTRGHKVIVSSSGGFMVGELKKYDVLHIKLDIRTKSELSPKLLFSIPRLLSLVRENNIHIIHAHTRVTQVLACIVSRLSGIPYVATCHGFFRARLQRRLFKCWGDKTIAISEAVKSHLIDDFKLAPKDVSLIHNGIDTERFKEEFSQEKRVSLKRRLNLKDGIVIGTIGRLSPVKGYKYLLEAFRLLLDEYRDLQLLIVGDGPEEVLLKSLAKRLKIDKYVSFAKPRLDTPAILSIMDIFVSSSVQEGLGLSLIEALASSKPVVAADVGGTSSLVKDGETGLLIRPKDSQALAKGILRLLRDPDLQDRLKDNGRRFVERDFKIDTMVDKIEKLYKLLGVWS